MAGMNLGDIKSTRLLYAKGLSFVILGVMSSGLLIAENPKVSTIILLAISIWSFARAYYFAFYVIEKYVDPEFRFSGLTAFFQYLWRKKQDES